MVTHREFYGHILPHVKDGDSVGIKRVKELVKSNPVLLYWSYRLGDTCYTRMVLHDTKSLELAEFFVEMDESLVGKDRYIPFDEWTLPIHTAIRDGNLPIVKLLVSRKPDSVRCSSSDTGTPMVWACRKARFDIMKYLYESDPGSLDDRVEDDQNILGRIIQKIYYAKKHDAVFLEIAKWILRERPHFAFEMTNSKTTRYHLREVKARKPENPVALMLDRFCQLHNLVKTIDEVVPACDGQPPSTEPPTQEEFDAEHEKLVLSGLAVVAHVLRDDLETLVSP